MKSVTRALLAFGLLLYAVSLFLPWFHPHTAGCSTLYWSFKAEYGCTTNPPRYGEVMFFDYWSSCEIGSAFFASEVFTFLFGLITLLKKVERKYELTLLGLTLFFLVMPIGVIILRGYVFWFRFLAGFWIANVAFLVLTASLLISLTRHLR